MSAASTAKLILNLSASQTRKRLKGHGLGVKRIEAFGRNQSVVFHTATGGHLRELKSLLSDVLASADADGDPPIANLRNLGATSAAWLRDVDVQTKSDLERLGPVVAYQLVKQRKPEASRNLLWALAGALYDCDWRSLSETQKSKLLSEIDE